MDRLPLQPWMTAAPTRRVMSALEAARPGCARFVGGCVRNALLGKPIDDIDIATQLTPEVVANVMHDAGMAVHPTGIEHGTLTIVADHHPFEVTTLRRDVETDGRRATVAFTEDWAEDAERRDFRINALYCDMTGQLFDPTGGGLDDIKQSRIVFVGDPETRIREDYLRILRFFRFYAWYGKTAPDAAGLAACSKLKAGLKAVSAERVWMEMKKLLAAPEPMASLQAMANSGILALVLPDFVGIGALEALVRLEHANGVSPDPMLRFQALHGGNESAVATAARKLKMSNEERDRLVFAARLDPLPSGLTPKAARELLYRKGAEVVRDNAILAWAAAGGDAGGWPDLVSQAESYVRPAMPVTGDDVMERGVASGPDVGVALRDLEARWIASDFALGRDELLRSLRKS
jgi:poly(A) polymerase